VKISVIIPAYNESECLPGSVREIHDHLAGLGLDFEILVVDDGSTDCTPAIVRDLRERYPRVRHYRHDANAGIGAALRTGFRHAGGDWFLFMPADGQFDIAEISRFLPFLETDDVIAGIKSGISDYSVYRRFNTRLFNMLFRLLFHLRLRDYNFVQMYRRRAIESLALSSAGIFITGEILAKSWAKGYRIRSVEATYVPRRSGRATGGRFVNAIKTVREMIRIRWEMSAGAGPVAPTPGR